MASLNSKRFAKQEILQKINHDSLLQWLAHYKKYFGERGLPIPEPASNTELDYDRLAAIFMEPQEDMPHDLVESLYIISEMATEAGMDEILAAATEKGLHLDLPEEHEPIDIALQAWLQNKALLEELHNQNAINKPRSFIYFSSLVDSVPRFKKPEEGKVITLQNDLNNWFAECKRGHGTKVFMYDHEDECWFLVRHGMPCKREGAIKDGREHSVFYRPQKKRRTCL